MSISLSKKSNLFIGSILLLIGICSYVFSVYIYIQPRKILDITVEMNKEIFNCVEQVKNSTFNVNKKDNKTLIINSKYTNKDLNMIEKEIYTSSLIIEKCSTLDLVNFCAGEGCSGGKLVTFELSYPLEKVSLEYN